MNGQMFDAVVKCFEEEHWKYLWVETAGETRFFTLIPRKKGEFLGMSRVREEYNEYVFSTYYEIKVSGFQMIALDICDVNMPSYCLRLRHFPPGKRDSSPHRTFPSEHALGSDRETAVG